MMYIGVQLFALLLLKHFFFDFLYQNSFMLKNKGIFMHPGGLLHSGLHTLSTLVILIVIIDPMVAVLLATFEFFAHYFIDFYKCKLNKKYKLTPEQKDFWVLLGFDQLLHNFTYFIIVMIGLHHV